MQSLKIAHIFKKRLFVDSADTLHVGWAVSIGAETFASFDRESAPRALAMCVGLKVWPEAKPKDKEHRGSLEGATLYVTLEPCPMCAGALVMTKCASLVYGARDAKAGACHSLYHITEDDRLNHRVKVTGGVMADDAKFLLSEFFKNLRKEKR